MTETVEPGLEDEPALEEPVSDAGGVRTYALTDYGNAERLVAEHGRDLRHASGLGWFVWDGRRWQPDADGEVLRRAKRSARTAYTEALELDGDARKLQSKWAMSSESAARLHAAVSLAESERPVIVRPDELDANPLLFCAQNGTIDLLTGTLREHRREDLLTKMSAAVYEPDARSELWERVLERATNHADGLADFLRRAAGYSMTGYAHEEVLLFLHGPTATAKSTIAEALRAAFGEYAMQADFESFLKRRGDAGVRNDIARLWAARIVFSVEVDEGKALAEGLLKWATGGEPMLARFLFKEPFEFLPRFTLWLAANERPRVRAEDAAIWRRILQVPFTEVIPEAERDERVKIELRTNPDVRAAILAWAVRGCLSWQERGLDVPDCVRDYTAEYRAENDPLREWLADRCRLGADQWTATAELRSSYESWCEQNGEKPLGTTSFRNALRAHGLIAEKRGGGERGWRGVAIGEDDEPRLL